MKRKRYSPRGENVKLALAQTACLGYMTPGQWCFSIFQNERTTLDVIHRLRTNGFLQQTTDKQQSLTGGRRDRIVYLTKTARDYLVVDQQILSHYDVSYFWDGVSQKPKYLRHDVAIRDVLTTFIAHCRRAPQRRYDMKLKPKGLRFESEETSPASQGRLLPDSIFAVSLDGQILELVLEVDLASENRDQWEDKVKKYNKSPEVMRSPLTRVLVVADSHERQRELMHWTQGIIVDKRFMFAALDDVIFKYQRDKKQLVLQQEGDPFGYIWHALGDDQSRCLFAPI